VALKSLLGEVELLLHHFLVRVLDIFLLLVFPSHLLVRRLGYASLLRGFLL
jgi:hypothetical protein